MNGDERHEGRQLEELASVARVARALVRAGGPSELSNDAMVEIRAALDLDQAALYLADGGASRVLRCVGRWPASDSRVDVAEVVSLDPAAWRFVAVSGGPLVFRERTGWVMENPFRPPADHWVVLPLVSEHRILGAVVGCSPAPISLSPAAVARFTVIGDLLSAGAANAILRGEIQKTELQRERMRLAEEIHDSLAQDLAVAVRELSLLETRPSPEIARASEDRLREAVLDAHRVVRGHLDALTADPEPPGLRRAVEEICARFVRRGLKVEIAGGVPDNVLDASRVVVVMRVLNEALANVQRHSGVAEATVRVTTEPTTLHLSVSDRGAGFDADSRDDHGVGHIGLRIMRERARAAGGAIAVRSKPGEGTTIELSLPAELLIS